MYCHLRAPVAVLAPSVKIVPLVAFMLQGNREASGHQQAHTNPQVMLSSCDFLRTSRLCTQHSLSPCHVNTIQFQGSVIAERIFLTVFYVSLNTPCKHAGYVFLQQNTLSQPLSPVTHGLAQILTSITHTPDWDLSQVYFASHPEHALLHPVMFTTNTSTTRAPVHVST